MQGLYSLSGKTSYPKISWNPEAARWGFKLFQSLWNLAGTSAAALPRCLSNFRAIRPLQHPISWLRDFTRFGGKTSYRLVNRGPGSLKEILQKHMDSVILPARSLQNHFQCSCRERSPVMRAHTLWWSLYRSYTTTENPSYFFMTLSCTEAIQSHFNQYSLVDPSWGNIPSWVWQGVSHWFRKLWRRVWHHRHFGNWISWI